MSSRAAFLLALALAFLFFTVAADSPSTKNASLPTLWIVGDSTVHNHGNDLVGWGDVIGDCFDSSKIKIDNRAIPGRSSRTYQTEGHWDDVLKQMKPGDFLLIQMGHNDQSPVNDDQRSRGTLKGTGEETEQIDNGVTHKHETVHTYGWYMRKYITDAKSKQVLPIICSLVPRDNWKDGKVARSTDTYVAWAKQIADEQHVPFIDLNDRVAAKYEQMGRDKANALFPHDHTHTNGSGAKLIAQTVVEGIRALTDFPLKSCLTEPCLTEP